MRKFFFAIPVLIALCFAYITFNEKRSGPKTIVAWGDSLTFGSGTVKPLEHAYPLVANTKLPEDTLINEGLGGQSSTEIAARMGVVPIELNLGEQDGLSRAVTSYSVNVLRISGKPRGTLKGTFSGQGATLTTDIDGNWSITFDTMVPQENTGVFIPAAADAYGDAPIWIWAGRNNRRQVDQVISDIALMVGNRPPREFLVLSIMTATNDPPDSLDRIAEINSQLQATYKGRFVDIGKFLNDVAKSPTPANNPPMTPAEFLTDNIHLNEAGYAHVGNYVARCWIGAC